MWKFMTWHNFIMLLSNLKLYIMHKLKSIYLSISLLVAGLLLNVISFAQDADKKIDIDISSEPESGFFMQPWVWVVAGAVFILLLVALLRKKD